MPDLKDMETCDLPDKDFNIVVLRKLIELQENKDYSMKIGKRIYEQNEKYNKVIDLYKQKNRSEEYSKWKT